jgi:hypothetical protein
LFGWVRGLATQRSTCDWQIGHGVDSSETRSKSLTLIPTGHFLRQARHFNMNPFTEPLLI